MLLKMLQDTKSQTVSVFSPVISAGSLLNWRATSARKPRCPSSQARELKGPAAETLYRTIQNTKIMAPPTNCLSPIGEKAILSGLYKQIKGEFYTAVSRPPAVYRGNPFVIEAGLAYGNRPGDQPKPEQPAGPRAEGEEEDDDAELARVIRYANRVPLLYQQSACASFKAALTTTWKNYGVPQSRGALPAGPMVIFVHMASVWVPFTSESKEAIADYDEIQKEITLALRECGRRLGLFLRRRERAASEYRRRNIFELYIEEVVEACNRLKGGKLAKDKIKMQLQKIATSRTGGSKTDEALGKTSGGPEGLPHSIIVTEEGVEGEVGAASQAEAADSRSEGGRSAWRFRTGRAEVTETRPEDATGTARHSTGGPPQEQPDGVVRQGRRRQTRREADTGPREAAASQEIADYADETEKTDCSGEETCRTCRHRDFGRGAVEDPTFAIPIRALSNVAFNERKGLIEMGTRSRPGRSSTWAWPRNSCRPCWWRMHCPNCNAQI